MKTQRIYLDTSVIGGCHDKEFASWSKGLMKDFRLRNYIPVLSKLTLDEVSAAPKPVRETMKALLTHEAEILEITESAIELSEQYLNRKILTPKFREDSLHIAIASLSKVDVLVSWNFKHIVHYDKIQLFNAVNMENGVKPISIYTPREVTNYEE